MDTEDFIPRPVNSDDDDDDDDDDELMIMTLRLGYF